MSIFKSQKPVNEKMLAKITVVVILGSFLAGGGAGYIAARQFFQSKTLSFISPSSLSDGEQEVVNVIEQASRAVVSIRISVDAPVFKRRYESYNPFGNIFPFEFRMPRLERERTERKVIGGGTGFFVSADGHIVTNRHVVSEKEAFYTVITSDGVEYDAIVLDRDPINDLAVIKVEGTAFPTLTFADSDMVKIGQRAIAIGYALGQFNNTVSVGVVSGLNRFIQASGGPDGEVEALEGLIQTDAAINHGNSGGPLLDSRGRVIGVNVAVAEGSQNIGFAIPGAAVRPVVETVKEYGRIVRPQLGVRYVLITAELAKEKKLSVNQGALLIAGSTGEAAVIVNSPAEKAGLKEGDIIIAVDGIRIDAAHRLGSLIIKYRVNDRITVTILRNGNEEQKEVTLEEWARPDEPK